MINVKTMTMQLINGEPNGIKICRIAGSSLVTIVVPRNQLSEARALPDIPSRGVYYLLDDHKGRLRKVYAGQTTQGLTRLDAHDSCKDWWNRAVMFLVPDSEFSMDVINGLEALAISYIRQHGAYAVENECSPRPYVSPYNEGFIADLHEEILFRMIVLGFDLDAVGDDGKEEASEIFHTTKRGIKGIGFYNASEGTFDVLEDSVIDMHALPGTQKKPNDHIIQLREELRVNGLIEEAEDGIHRLCTKVSFDSPSAAAVFVLGGSQNGWTEWIDSIGRTLSSVYRD